MTNYDVVTFGEPLLRLTPPNFQRYEQTQLFERHVGGSELNTSVGLARLGLDVAFFSRMTDDPIGRLIERELITQGVHTDEIIWTDEGRTGIYYMEEAKSPRPSQVTYDRLHSAISLMQPIHIPDEFPATKLFHLSGITPALSDSAYRTSLALLEQAKENAAKISFDVNYRAKLWSIETAAERCKPFIEAADVVFIAQRDALRLYHVETLEALHAMSPQAVIVMTQGSAGAVAIDSDGEIYSQGIFEAETVCRIGGGDAFSAGFLYAYLQFGDVQKALQYGAATAALKYSLPGDLPLVDLPQVEGVIAANAHDSVHR